MNYSFHSLAIQKFYFRTESALSILYCIYSEQNIVRDRKMCGFLTLIFVANEKNT